MTRTTNRRAVVLLAGAAAVTALAAGCSAGQHAETARKRPSVPGVNAEFELRADERPIGRVSVRNALVVYPGPKGYPAGGEAPIELTLFNDSAAAVTVRVSAPRVAGSATHLVQALGVRLVGGSDRATWDSSRVPLTGATPSPSPLAGSASPGVGGEAGPGATRSAAATPGGTRTPSPGSAVSPGSAASPGAGRTPSPAAGPTTITIPAYQFVVLTPQSSRHLALTGLAQPLTSDKAVVVLLDAGNGAQLRLELPVGVPSSAEPRPSPVISEETDGEH